MNGLINRLKAIKETIINRKIDMQKLFKCHARRKRDENVKD